MDWYSREEQAEMRMNQLRIEAKNAALGRRHGAHWSLADAVCRWRTRIGGALMDLGRLIVPADGRAGIPARRNSC